jgi:hypothetical protein
MLGKKPSCLSLFGLGGAEQENIGVGMLGDKTVSLSVAAVELTVQ